MVRDDWKDAGAEMMQNLMNFFFMFIFETEHVHTCVHREGAEREGRRGSKAGSEVSAQSPMPGLNS